VFETSEITLLEVEKMSENILTGTLGFEEKQWARKLLQFVYPGAPKWRPPHGS
jgi:hypothetical protein